MPLLSLNIPESRPVCSPSDETSTAKKTTTMSPPVPRFVLRKRTVSSDRESIQLATVNSAFLSGLFADVAQATKRSESSPPSGDDNSQNHAPADEESRLDASLPVKKSRSSMSRSISRCGRSFMVLDHAAAVVSPGAREIFKDTLTDSPLGRSDSLHYQLSCVSNADSSNENDGTFSKTVLDATKLAFPQLPAAVSQSSYSTSSPLTRTVSDLQVSLAEPNTHQKESYGWFVEMDGDQQERPNLRTVTSELAFSAPTAPKAENYDAEVEWAKAADTVDDVLGDFF